MVTEFSDDSDVSSLAGAKPQEQAAQDMSKKRRNAFCSPVGSAGKSKDEEEKDDDGMMRDELYG